MIRFFANANYDFIGVRRYAYMVTGALFAVSLIALLAFGLNYSIEFTGGTLVRVKAAPGVDAGQLRSALDAQGVHGAEIQSFGAPGEFIIRARTAKSGSDADNTQETANAIHAALDQVVGAGKYT